eukprot:scaffold100_cov357-Prasinococcus_capsulatus_cf.AAC.2
MSHPEVRGEKVPEQGLLASLVREPGGLAGAADTEHLVPPIGRMLTSSSLRFCITRMRLYSSSRSNMAWSGVCRGTHGQSSYDGHDPEGGTWSVTQGAPCIAQRRGRSPGETHQKSGRRPCASGAGGKLSRRPLYGRHRGPSSTTPQAPSWSLPKATWYALTGPPVRRPGVNGGRLPAARSAGSRSVVRHSAQRTAGGRVGDDVVATASWVGGRAWGRACAGGSFR